MTTLKRYALVMAAGLLTACGGDDDKKGTPTDPGNGGETVGNFTATIAGDMTASLSGEAAHASVSQGESQGFVFAFEDTPSANTATASIIFIKEDPALPGVGAHAVKMDENMTTSQFGMLAAVTDAQGTEWLCIGSTGTVNVTSSSSSRMRGSFNVTSDCINPANEEEQAVTLQGNFDSRTGAMPTSIAALR